jgi:hypothetical protein
MKKMLSLAAMCAVLAYASPASAELKLGGDASVRLRDVSYSGDTADTKKEDAVWQYRVRLNASADLGEGYFFKAMLTDENNGAGGWQSVGNNVAAGGNQEKYILNVSNFYFGRMLKDSHYMAGRLPLGSFNNPIFDLTLYPTTSCENPVANIYYDRVYGLNYGTKIGDGMLNATLVVLDNEKSNDTKKTGDGLFNDGYALHLDYKVNIGKVTFEPQFLTALTNASASNQPLFSSGYYTGFYDVTPYTFGANLAVPAGSAKLSFGAFYTSCNDTTPQNTIGVAGTKVDYNAYQFRIKGEIGNFMAFYDYNHATDKATFAKDATYTNNFVWAQYKIPVYSSAAGSFTLQPTVRYATNKVKYDGATPVDQQRLRTELWATVTF